MKNIISIILMLILAVLFGCNNDRKFSALKKLSTLQKTLFIPTIEHKISSNKNTVYCATLLFAWNEIKQQFPSPLTISNNYPDLQMLHKANTFVNVLNDNEYTANGEIDGNIIKASAIFNKSLPFEIKLESFGNRLVFDGQKVASFGITGNNSFQQQQIVDILYYKNDKNFIIKLLPKEPKHEIILFMTNKNLDYMAEAIKEVEKLTKIGKSEKKDKKTAWKYFFNEEDELIIPQFNFNIETNYNTLEGNGFSVGTKKFIIEEAYQRTAFILDESGATIESKAETAAYTGIEEEIVKPKPKKMIFDQAFLLLLKRIDAKYPYFGLWAANSELMTKQ